MGECRSVESEKGGSYTGNADDSGFNRDDLWGFRSCEPGRNIISSMALVLLKTGIIHPGMEGSEPGQTSPFIDFAQMHTAEKLLLFWRKPAVSLGQRAGFWFGEQQYGSARERSSSLLGTEQAEEA